MKRFIWFFLIFTVSVFKINAQVISVDSEQVSANKGDLILEVKSTSFFDNLEFFNDIQKGYTLTGFNAEPHLAYAINSKAKISGGFHLLSFFGEETITRVVPVLTIQTQLTPNLTLNIGNIDASGCHGLPEPLYKPEREFTHQPEGGLQFLYNSERFVADTWLDWERFLFPKDTIQEEFTVGLSGKILPISNDLLNIELPFYALAVHKGGQINVTDERVSTLANFGGGVNISYLFKENSRVGVEGLMLFGRDLSPNPHHDFEKGWAVFPRIYLKTKDWFFDVGYWRASEMILPRGEQIFGSVSTIRPELNQPQRELITGNIIFRKDIARGFKLAFGGQVYYDARNPLLDYRFSIVAFFNESFLLKGK